MRKSISMIGAALSGIGAAMSDAMLGLSGLKNHHQHLRNGHGVGGQRCRIIETRMGKNLGICKRQLGRFVRRGFTVESAMFPVEIIRVQPVATSKDYPNKGKLECKRAQRAITFHQQAAAGLYR